MHSTVCPICRECEKKQFRENFDYFECEICKGVYVDSRLVRAPTQLDDYLTLLGASREMREKYGWPATIRFDGVVDCPDENGAMQTMTEFPKTVAEKAAKLLGILVKWTTHFGEKITLKNADYGLAYAKSEIELRAFVDYLREQGCLSIAGNTMHDLTVIVSADALDKAKRSEPPRPMQILFLAANPILTRALDLEEELRSLEGELRGVKYRDRIACRACHAVRPDDLIRYVRENEPNVLHFSGHGSAQGIILRSDSGGPTAVRGAALGQFLNGRGVELVVLNSCFSKGQADAIRGAVKVVVGTTDAVDDEAARRFTIAFYRALGSGLSVEEAFRDGGDAVQLHGLTNVFHSEGDLSLKLIS